MNKGFYEWLTRRLRRISLYWPERTKALAKARIERGKYLCAKCKGIFSRKEVHVDHIKPIVEFDGFKDWDQYISSLFCSAKKLQILCKPCHKEKTNKENKKRLTKDNK